MFKLPQLSYAKNELSPFLNEEQITFHYEKHHKAYIDNLNKFVETDVSLKGKSIEEIVLNSTGGVFNNAAQIWNHTFYWFNIAKKGYGGSISTALNEAIKRDFTSLDELKAKFIDGGVKTFGSGWIWLCTDASGKLSLVSTSNAAVPFTNNGPVPILTADVWEHAYYIDYKNLRAKYLETFWDYINWSFVSENYESKKVRNLTQSMT
ncbi:MAG: superoxide dismutase [Leptospiraceae bacterium]|nr:superoxide dismutase [Leptospiraceae bacterium]MCK6381099.1 superoxide dismutase [Leptospiraceae bacterium]NUM40536.1 superoxide dismutase [Leptospiraceae bacterium]